MQIEFNTEPLSEEEEQSRANVLPEVVRIPIVPIPGSVLEPVFQHPEFGSAKKLFPYFARGQDLVGYVAHFDDPQGGRHYLPLTYCQTGEKKAWHAYGLPRPYPIFNGPAILARPGAPILVVRGERNVEAAALLWPGLIPVCCPYGDSAISHVDWSMLEGREVYVFPHVDERSSDFFSAVSSLAYRSGAKAVRKMDLRHVARLVWKDGVSFKRAKSIEEWDAAKAVEEGWTAEKIDAVIGNVDQLPSIPKPLVYDDLGRPIFIATPSGIEGLYQKYNRDGIEEHWIHMGDRLELLAQSRSASGEGWGKRFQFWNDDGEAVTVDLSAKDLVADGTELRRVLLDLGFNMGHSREQRELLLRYVTSCKTSARILNVDTVGWHGQLFITSNGVIGTSASGEQVRYTGPGKSVVCAVGGTETSWQKEIAELALGNSMLVFGISTALSAALLKHTGGESGGFHVVGSSSTGKTTLLHIAGSVWGGGRINGYLDSWRSTDNAAEAIAASHCDALLALDEIGQATSKAVSALAYMLANGTGKSRMTKGLGVRDPLQWRVTTLSTGEVSIETKISEDSRAARSAAGQLVRIVNISADVGKGHGVFENLHGYPSAAEFARVIKTSAMSNYGHLATAYIKKLIEDMSHLPHELGELKARFLVGLSIPENADGQVKRVAEKFALVAAAGELAIEYGLLTWPRGTAAEATKSVFNRWLADRGGIAANEEMEAISHIRHLILTQRETRFQRSSDSEKAKTVRDSLGFIHHARNHETYHCIYADAWVKDACAGRNSTLVAEALRKRGFLHANTDRDTAIIRFNDVPYRVYAVKGNLLAEPVTQPAKLQF